MVERCVVNPADVRGYLPANVFICLETYFFEKQLLARVPVCEPPKFPTLV
jgi:hypothetical protein